MKTASRHSPDIEKWIRLIRCEGMGPVTFFRLLKKFRSLDRILTASVHELCKAKNVGPSTAEKIIASKDSFNVDRELELAQKLGISIINILDKRYPPPLKKIYDPPPLLYVKGSLDPADSLALAIVGSRRCTTYGSEQASRFAHMLASSGFCIVSGMASGIDTAAHSGALTAGGRTIAVQGCGLGSIFPPENTKLFHTIAENGACISELPIGFIPQSKNFPSRNRIISGLSMATLVVEASNRSGALITAKAALDQDRQVMAIPSPIDSPAGIGSNRLIKQGAALVDSVEDIMDALGYIGQDLKPHATVESAAAGRRAEMPLFDTSQIKLTADERMLFEALDHNALHCDELIAKTNLAPGKANSALVSLQLKALIKQLPGNYYKKR